MESDNVFNQKDRDVESIKEAKIFFDDTSNNYKLMKQYEETFDEIFLKVKLAFIGFIGVLLTIIFANIDKFTSISLISLNVILILVFILLIIEWWLKLQDLYNALAYSYKSNVLAKVMHIATMQKDKFSHYGQRVEQILTQRDELRQAMENNETINIITKLPKNRWKPVFIIWSILFLITPILLILEVLDIFR